MNDKSFTLEGRNLPEKEQKALDKHYEEYGVGSDVKQKRKHWEKFFGDVISISHVETDDEWVGAYEFFWLTDEFPDDYPSC